MFKVIRTKGETPKKIYKHKGINGTFAAENKNMYKRESGSNDRNSGKPRGGKPFTKTTAAKKTGGSGPRGGKSFDKPAGKGFGDKKPYGKTTRSESSSFDKGPRKGFSDRKPADGRPRFGESDASKSYDRAPRNTRSYGEEKTSGYSDGKSSGPRSNFRDKDGSKPFDRAPRKTRSYGEDSPRAGYAGRKPSGPRSNFRDKDDSSSSDRVPRKTRSYGEEKPGGYAGRKPTGSRTSFRDKDEAKAFDKTPRKTRSYGEDKPSLGPKKGPRSTNPYNRTPRKSATPEGDKPARFGDRRVTREEGESRRASKSFTFNDDKLKSRSGRGPRKGDVFVEKKKGQKDDTPQVGNIRLNRYIANAGVCSRREADDLILAGLVTVNGVAIEEMGYQVKPTDDVRYNGERLSREKKVYILLNKPKDAITTADDPEGRRTVMQLFGNELGERIYPVGRLDRNTTGVLLFTNDGDLAQRLMHPKYEMKKVYKATLDKTFKGEDMWQLTNGVELEDGFIKPDAIAYPNAKDKKEVGIEIHSGKNHVIHRIFESLGYKVDKLDRALYGGLTKGKLKRGEWRELTEKEVGTLKRTLKLS
jgi:23S rRNA pseudouridine2605 synthase